MGPVDIWYGFRLYDKARSAALLLHRKNRGLRAFAGKSPRVIPESLMATHIASHYGYFPVQLGSAQREVVSGSAAFVRTSTPRLCSYSRGRCRPHASTRSLIITPSAKLRRRFRVFMMTPCGNHRDQTI